MQYDPEIAEEICELIANSDQGLRAILKSDDRFPTVSTWHSWVANHSIISERYAHAKRQQIEMMAEDIVDIANDDTLEPNDKRLRIDTRKWLLSKLMAKTYGDKLDVTSGGEALAVPSHQIDARVQSIIMQAQARRLGVGGADSMELDANALKLLD